MTTIELLAYCRARKPEPYVPDLRWQHGAHRISNLDVLCSPGGFLPNSGFHDTHNYILEDRSWLVEHERTYATVLFTEDTACSAPQE